MIKGKQCDTFRLSHFEEVTCGECSEGRKFGGNERTYRLTYVAANKYFIRVLGASPATLGQASHKTNGEMEAGIRILGCWFNMQRYTALCVVVFTETKRALNTPSILEMHGTE